MLLFLEVKAMRPKQAVIVRNDFSNKHNPGHGSSINRFIQGYAARPGAIQSLPGPGMAKEWNDTIDTMYDNQQFNSKEMFEALAGFYLKTEGISFDSNHLSLNSDQLAINADKAQQAYLDGHSVLKLVISFDTDYLIQQNVLDLPEKFDQAGYGLPQALPGGSFDLVDQTKLRFAIQRGMNTFTQEAQMNDPLWVATIQFDTGHVHSHVACIDQGPLAQSKRLLMYNGTWQDRGEVLARGRQIIRQGVDEALMLTKGIHRNTVNNQLAREVVKSYSANFDIRQQYQKQLANQLLFLLRLNEQRQQMDQGDEAEQLYQQKLSDYRDSLVMQEAKVFALPKNMTRKIEQELDQALDQQIQTLGQQGIPDEAYVQSGNGTFVNSSLGRRLQEQATQQRSLLTHSNRALSSWQYLIHDFDQKYQRGQVGNGSFAMDNLYRYEFNRELKRLTVFQSQNPLGLMDNYRDRSDLVDRRKQLLVQREKLLEDGYRSGLLLNVAPEQLNALLNNRVFKERLVQTDQSLKELREPWLAFSLLQNQRAEDLPAYADLVMKANSANNEFGVSPDTVDLMARMKVDQNIVNGLSGNNLSPKLRQALAGNHLDRLNYDPFLKQYVNHWRAYQMEVLDYELAGTQRGLVRPSSNLFNSYQLLIPARIDEPLNVRSEVEEQAWNYLTQDQLTGRQQASLFNDLRQEQALIKAADFYVQHTNQQSLPLINVKSRQQNWLQKLPQAWQNNFKQQIQQDRQAVSLTLGQRGSHKHEQKSTSEPQSKPAATLSERQAQDQALRQQRLIQNVNQQQMSDDEADSVVNQSRRIVRNVLDNELASWFCLLFILDWFFGIMKDDQIIIIIF